MSGFVEWIGAQADDPDPGDALKCGETFEQSDEQSPEESAGCAPWRDLPAHNFAAPLNVPNESQLEDDPLDRNPDLWMYRSRTVALLRRYLRFSPGDWTSAFVHWPGIFPRESDVLHRDHV
jgi:hypothetical protein